MTLKDAEVGSTVVVTKIEGDSAYKRRIMDMGITKGSELYIRKVAPLGDPQHAVAYLGAEPGRIGALRIVDDSRSLRIGNLHEADIDRRGDLDGRERRQPLAALPSGRVGSCRDRRGNGSSRHRPAHRIGGGKPRCAGRDTDGNPCQKGRQNQSLHLFFHGPKS